MLWRTPTYPRFYKSDYNCTYICQCYISIANYWYSVHCLYLLSVHVHISIIVIDEPDDVTACEGREVVFTCVLNSKIRSGDVQWYRFIKDTSTTEMVDPDGDNIYFIVDTEDSDENTTSTLTITDVIKSYTGYFWVGTPSLNVCNASLTVLTSM